MSCSMDRSIGLRRRIEPCEGRTGFDHAHLGGIMDVPRPEMAHTAACGGDRQ